MLIVIAEIKMKAGELHNTNVIDAFKDITPIVIKEDGCLAYDMLTNHQPEVTYQTPLLNTLIMYEKWQSIYHLDKHLQSAHMQKFQERIKEDLLEVKIKVLENIIN